ncbi:acyltransferase family protein [Ideonella sp.]|uniref:acyltransferase family protein n=1 Tax=Ideonella sp. TaxID=1929293 RepID=UPI003BB64A4C
MSQRSIFIHRHAPAPLVDWGKALASQLIVWHHLALYGPLPRMAMPLLPDLLSELLDAARLMVQVFLVIGGFLAARSLMPRPGLSGTLVAARLPALLWQRYWRLAKPALPAIALALLAAAVARMVMDDADTPASPGWLGLLANVFMLQDLLGEPALSAGLWYLAIDLQLFMMLAALSCLLGLRWLRGSATASWLLVGGLTAASLFVFNLDSSLDAWGLYFFGAYGLGVMAQWVHASAHRRAGTLALALLCALALWVEWRSRLALASTVALLLAGGWSTRLNAGLAGSRANSLAQQLARLSYPLFLLHYPVSLLMASIVTLIWPESAGFCLLGLLAAWAASLLLAAALQAWLEPTRRAPAQPATLPSGWATR